MTPQHSERLSKIKVAGMTCGHCQRAVESAIRDLEGVSDVQVDLKLGQATVIGNVSDEQIAAAVEESRLRR
jgi:copper chaperone